MLLFYFLYMFASYTHICIVVNTPYQLCTASIVNDPGYRIDDAAIDASSVWQHSVHCKAAAARFDYNTYHSTLGWCICK